MKKKERLADFEIDKLTNSIENVRTAETFDTEITQLKAKDMKLIHKRDWLFDWKIESRRDFEREIDGWRAFSRFDGDDLFGAFHFNSGGAPAGGSGRSGARFA